LARALALVAALAGFTDFFGESRIRDLDAAGYHVLANLTAVVIAIRSFFCATRKAPTRPFCRGALFCSKLKKARPRSAPFLHSGKV
jgi:hypothetical protein